jgi:biopolymer transport protein ExbD
MRPRPATTTALRAEINVTPLVDVCLVLLIIFMVVTPMLHQEVVALPETARPERLPERSRQLTLTARADGVVRIGSGAVREGDLAAALAAIHAATPDREIVLKADRRLPYREVRRILRQVEQARFTQVGLVTERKEP